MVHVDYHRWLMHVMILGVLIKYGFHGLVDAEETSHSFLVVLSLHRFFQQLHILLD